MSAFNRHASTACWAWMVSSNSGADGALSVSPLTASFHPITATMSPATASVMSWVWSACTRTSRLIRRPCACCELATWSPTFKRPEYSRTKLNAAWL
ncbi:hypothetical protein D3C71_1300500 [compost metagenome]